MTWGMAGLVPAVALIFLPAWPAVKDFSLATGVTLLALAWAWRRLGRREALAWPPLTAPLLALLATGVLLVAKASVSWDGLKAIYASALLYLVYLIVAEAGVASDPIIIMGGIVVSALAMALVGIAQVLAPTHFAAWAAEGRAIGTLGNTNYAGAFLGPSLIISLGIGWAARGRMSRILLNLCAGAVTVALILTRARGAWVGVAAGIAALLALGRARDAGTSRRERLLLPVLILAAAVGGAELILRADRSSVLSTLATLFDPGYASNAARLSWWAGTLRLVRDSPLLGVGPGKFAAAYVPLVERPEDLIGVLVNVEHPHNELLNFVAERGILGLGLLIWMLAQLVRAAGTRLADREPGGWYAATAASALLAGAVHGQFFYVLREPATATLLAVLLGLVARPTSERGTRSWASRAIPLGVALASLLLWEPFAFAPAAAQAVGREGRNALAGGRAERAAVAFARARTWEPLNGAWAFELGLAERRAGRSDAAAQALEAGRRLNPSDMGILNNLGVVYLELKRFAAAREVYRHGLAVNPRFASAHQNLGVIALEEGRSREAISHLTRALALLRQNPLGWYNLALAYTRAGDSVRAEPALGEAVSMDPSLAIGWYALAQLEASTGRLREAREALGRAIAVDPGLRQSARTDPRLMGLLEGS